MPTPLISVENLTLELEGRRLLDGVTFDVMPGEHIAVIGPNGAGKTTLLRAIDLIYDNWSGEIRLQGETIRSLSRKRIAQKIAFVQQLTTTVFSLTVRQVVEMGRYPHLKALSPVDAEDERIVQNAMRDMAVSEFSDRLLETLSGGERQRVLIAAALAQQPEILLLDEPATFLDYRHQSELYGFLRDVGRDREMTVIEITHDVNRALGGASRVLALVDGRLTFDGTPAELLRPKILHGVYGVEFRVLPASDGQPPIVWPMADNAPSL